MEKVKRDNYECDNSERECESFHTWKSSKYVASVGSGFNVTDFDKTFVSLD